MHKQEKPMSDTLKHEGYDGSVWYSADDEMLYGRILGIRDMVTYGGKSVSEIKRNFCDAVDEYLAFYKEVGREPNIPAKAS